MSMDCSAALAMTIRDDAKVYGISCPPLTSIVWPMM